MVESTRDRPLRIAIVAGEASGDILGASLIRELRKHHANLTVEGICGPLMIAEGCVSYANMNTISIMGLDGLLGSLRKILRIRGALIARFLETPPDIFIGIDVPDFNLTIEEKLKSSGIRTIHYVSPTVWAWRGYRIHKIRRAVSRMLVLFPFEAKYYEKHNVPVTFVGHPVADDISMKSMSEARDSLGLPHDQQIVAILPGSRHSEVSRLASVFAQTAARLHRQFNNTCFVIPCASNQLRSIIENEFTLKLPQSCFEVIDGNALITLQSADAALVASGTAALECALVGTPMVVSYRMSFMSYQLVKFFSHVEHYSMPNHLLDGAPVAEFIQHDAKAENIEPAIARLLTDKNYNKQIRARLQTLLPILKCNASKTAAEAIIEVLSR